MPIHRFFAALALVPLLAAPGCRSEAPYRIGVALGSEGVAMATYVAEQINAAGGINGRPLELVLEREASTTIARPALEAAARLIDSQDLLAVVGHANSGATLAAAQIYNTHGVPQVAPTSTSPILANAGPWTFQMVASDAHQGRFLSDAITRCGPAPRVALLYVNDDYGRGLERVVRASLTAANVPLVHVAPVADVDEFAGDELARAIAVKRPDVVLWLARAPSLRRLLPPLRARLPQVRVLASDGIETVQLVRGGDPDLVGVRFVRFLPTTAESPALSSLERRFQRRFPEMRLTGLAVLTYDAMTLVVDALRAGVDSRAEMRGHLEALGRDRDPFRGLSGAIAFDSTGAARPRYRLAEVTPTGMRPTDPCAPVAP